MERIKLNLIPSGVAPIVHLSQYDDGRQFGIDLFEGESVYVLDGTETLTVNSRKPDGHVVVLTVTNTGTSSLDVDTVEQLTAVHGVSYAKLKIEKGSVTIATLPFLIDVSRDPLENGDPSESFIQNLETQVSEMVAEDVAEQYDSSNVIFDNEPTDNHGIGYAVTSEGIKTAIDNAFDYDNTASGSLVHIEDGADNIPMKSCEITIEPDLTGYTETNLVVCGKNWFNDTVGTHTVMANTDRTIDIGNVWLKANQTYVISCKQTPNAVSSFVRNILIVVGNGQTVYNSAGNDYTIKPMVFTPTASGIYSIRLWEHTLPVNTSYSDFQVELGDTATTFEAYNGTTYNIPFGQTITSGGTLNVISGELAITGGSTVQLTPVNPKTISGVNNICNDCGNTAIEYYTNKATDVLNLINSEIGKKNGTNILIEANSPDSIKTYIDNEVSTITTSLSGKADKTEDATITVESGYTLISSSCGKTDRLVHLNFNVEKSDGFATGWQVIGTTDFKPNTLAYCPLWNVTNGVANGEVRIDTDGTINFYVITAGELRLNANIGYITD